MKAFRACSPPRERGVVMYVCLIMLMVLSLIAISSANNSIVEERMVGNMRNDQLARLAAESALNEARQRVLASSAEFGADQVCAHLACFVRPAGLSPADLMRTAAAQAAATTFRVDMKNLQLEDGNARLAASPVYLIEDAGVAPPGKATPPTPNPHQFRITARGFGGDLQYDQTIEKTISIAN
jgi:type IV pilus assembly protein PilX